MAENFPEKKIKKNLEGIKNNVILQPVSERKKQERQVTVTFFENIGKSKEAMSKVMRNGSTMNMIEVNLRHTPDE